MSDQAKQPCGHSMTDMGVSTGGMKYCRACGHVHDVAAQLAATRARLAEAEAIIAKLPKTADGVPIVPGMTLYSARTKTIDTDGGGFLVGKVGDGPGWFYGALLREAGPLYSTRDAALAAAAPPAAGDTGGTRA